MRGIIGFVRGVFTVDQIDYVKATESIKKDLSFKGFNVWILVCSILVCSLGLNLNNTAIIIGAMLISPLMGPINGLGLAIGTYDRALLNRSLKNLAVATVVSVLTAAVFFRITPTADNLNELFSRTQPIILDLFVAFFGGVAGILAASRALNTNVVPGVAIATALMPPLCTAGYGLATLQMDYFFGAFYLFFMNCVMISLAAVLIVLYLKYPKFSFVDDRTKRKVKNSIIAFVLVFSVPSMILYYKLLQEGWEKERVEHFVQEELRSNVSIYVTNYERIDQDSVTVLAVSINGKYLKELDIQQLRSRLAKYDLNDYKLVIYQNEYGLASEDLESMGQQFKSEILSDLYDRNEQKLKNREDEIALLQNELARIRTGQVQNDKWAKLLRSQFSVEEIAFDRMVLNRSEGADTVLAVLVRWNKQLSRDQQNEQKEKMADLFRIQYESEDVRILELNH